MTGKPEPATESAVPLTRARVAEYLRAHPEFIARNPDLWGALPPPRRALGDGVADLQAAMIERLRDDVRRLEDKAGDLARTARDHRSLGAQVHKAALALMATRELAFLVEAVTTDLAALLGVDVAVLAVEAEPPVRSRSDIAGIRCVAPGTIAAIMGPKDDVVFIADGVADQRVFGSAVGLARSLALARLGGTRRMPPALLAIGARHPDRFQPGRGEDLIRYLAQVLELCLRTRLDLPC